MKKAIHVLTVIHHRTTNPFMSILAKGIVSDSIQVDTDIHGFWDRKKKYDIVHIHLPEFFFYSKKWNLPTKEFGEFLSGTIRQWKKAGAIIVYTRHDETTHYVLNKEVKTNLYEIIESEADVIVHMGNYSKDQMLGYKHVKTHLHEVIPQHIFNELYHSAITRSEARKALGIDEKFRVILAFGTFRDEEEHMLVKNVLEQLNDSNKYLFAPSWYHDGFHEYRNTQITIAGNCWLGRGSVDKNMLPYCFAAADVVFLQRLRNLNSGNLPMGFLFNKTVVGPAIGNITELLDNVNNFSFNPHDPVSVLQALEKGLERSLYPQVNETYARKHWTTAKICSRYRQLFQQLIH